MSQLTASSARAQRIVPFRVMEVLERAQALERSGRDVLHLEAGELDYAAPQAATDAARAALAAGQTRYTHSQGTPELRAAIAAHYATLGAAVDPANLIVSSGTSPLLALALATVLDPGDEVLVADPGYPCYRNFAEIVGAVARPVPVTADQGFRPDPQAFRAAIGPRTKAILLGTPANPTGALLDATQLDAFADLGPWLIVDEIYRGLVYDGAAAHSATALARDNVIVVDGFSKRYAMTGFRLGWIALPERVAAPARAIQQNLTISANAFVQAAGLAVLRDPAMGAQLAAWVAELGARRNALVHGLRAIGVTVPAVPAGAFYVMSDMRALGRPSLQLAFDILDATGVALTPGSDFGAGGEGFLRWTFAKPTATIAAAIERVAAWLRA